MSGMSCMGGMGGMGASKGGKAMACDMHEIAPHDGHAHGNDGVHDADDDGSHAVTHGTCGQVRGQHEPQPRPSSDTGTAHPERWELLAFPVFHRAPGDRGCCWLLSMDRTSRPPVAMVALRDFVALSVDARFHAWRAWRAWREREWPDIAA